MIVDLVAYDRNGQLVLIVEAKKKLGASTEWASRMRRNMYAHGLLPNAPYFLLALPDRFFLWREVKPMDYVEPSYEIDPQPYLKPYYEGIGASPDDVSGQALEILVAAWLTDAMRTDYSGRESHEEWMLESGLLEAIKGGRLDSEVRL